MVTHDDTDPQHDEGDVQKNVIKITRAVISHERIYVSIWAENQVSLFIRNILIYKIHVFMSLYASGLGTPMIWAH